MIRLDCAAATRASTERGGTGSGPPARHRETRCWISLARLDSRVSELALPVSESGTGRHPEAD